MKKIFLVIAILISLASVSQAQTYLRFMYQPFNSDITSIPVVDSVNMGGIGIERRFHSSNYAVELTLGGNLTNSKNHLIVGSIGVNRYFSELGNVEPFIGFSGSFGNVQSGDLSSSYYSVGGTIGFNYNVNEDLGIGGEYNLNYNINPNSSNSFSTGNLGLVLKVRLFR